MSSENLETTIKNVKLKVTKYDFGLWIWINNENDIRISIDEKSKIHVTIWNKQIDYLTIYSKVRGD